MEIYRNTIGATVRLDTSLAPDANDTIVAKRGNRILHVFDTVGMLNVDGFLELTLPPALVLTNQSFDIHWTFALGADIIPYVTEVEIISPILSIAEIMEITGGNRESAVRVERRVRKTIEGITGAKFYPYSATHRLTSRGSNTLVLPDRLLKLNSLNFGGYEYPLANLIITDNTISIDPDRWLTIKSDYHGYPGQNVVWNPTHFNAFNSRLIYDVDGIWGYPQTPGAVEEAARLLVKDYGCNEDAWRQKGLTSISAADWRFEFSSRAHSGTGNIDADRLIQPYVVSGAFII